jgi:phosphomannomutase
MIDESIFKAYDIRGVSPDSLNEDVARDIGRAFVARRS